jgi:hypothetical protein
MGERGRNICVGRREFLSIFLSLLPTTCFCSGYVVYSPFIGLKRLIIK